MHALELFARLSASGAIGELDLRLLTAEFYSVEAARGEDEERYWHLRLITDLSRALFGSDVHDGSPEIARVLADYEAQLLAGCRRSLESFDGRRPP